MSTHDEKSTRVVSIPVALEAEPVEPVSDPSEFDVVETLEAIRRRPGMYVGGIDDNGLYHLFKEILKNSVDEVLAGQCTEIAVVYKPDGSLSVVDDGRGIPVEVVAATGKVFAELIFTELCAAERYGFTTRDWHGIGAAIVNALSAWLGYEVRRDGNRYQQRFTRGIPDSPLTIVGACGPEEHGTTVTWLADAAVFTQALDESGNPHYNLEGLRRRLRELAYLNPGVTFTFHDTHDEQEPETYHYLRGIAEFVAQVNEDKGRLHPEVIAFSDTREDIHIEIALQYNQTDEEEIYAYVNTRETCLGGTHVEGFERALIGVLNRYARNNNLLSEGDTNISRVAVCKGLTAVVAVRLANPMFPGATRERLGNSEVARIVRAITRQRLSAYLSDNPQTAQAIIDRMVAAP